MGLVNCEDSELYTYLLGLEEGYLPTCCLDTCRSVPSRSIHIASRSYRAGRKTVVFHGFQFLMILENSTGVDGEDLLMLSVADFRARTSVVQVAEKVLMARGLDCGLKWRELSVMYDRDMYLWRTHRCLWEEDLQECLVTLPRWGMMQNGVCWELMMSVHHIEEIESGFWPTPTAMDGRRGVETQQKKKAAGRYTGVTLNDAVGGISILRKYPTPTSSMLTTGDLEQARYSGTDYRRPSYQIMNTGPLNPAWVEWLMGWPIGWTDYAALGMDKYHSWLRLHGKF